MSFNSSQVVVHGDATNRVNGNQYNASVIHVDGQGQMSERTEYGDYRYFPRGDVYLVKEVHRNVFKARGCRHWGEDDCECAIRAQEIVYSVKVDGRTTKFTAVEYQGKGGQEIWEGDLRRFSQHRTPETWQLYGLSCSKIPLLIFHGELVPLANFYKKSFWGDIYLGLLRRHLRCFVLSQIWLDMEGNLCKGLWGPVVEEVLLAPSAHIYVPSTSVQMLQSDDICFEFLQQFSSSQLDRSIVHCAYFSYQSTSLDYLFPEPTNHHLHSHYTNFHQIIPPLFHQTPPSPLTSDMFDGLRFDTVYSPSRGAVARCPRAEVHCSHWGVVNKTKVGNGLIRFKLDDPQHIRVCLECAQGWLQEGWLAQSSRIMDAHEMSGMEETCFIIDPPSLYLRSASPLKYQKPSLTVKNLPSIYLFIYRPPLSISELKSWKSGLTRTHFWSLDEDGHSEMSEEEHRRWEVPELRHVIENFKNVWSRCWPTHVYTTLRKWQVAHGFDPATSDWAQSLGYPEWEIIGGKEEEAWFEGVRDYVSYLSKLHEQDAELQLGPVRCPSWSPVTLTTRRRSWPATSLPNWHVTSGSECTTSNRTQSLDNLKLEITDAEVEALLLKFRLEAFFRKLLCEPQDADSEMDTDDTSGASPFRRAR